ncbi:MAG: hypothetical protein IE880_06575, partial [Epsilonproteobacteria bacterium]|nr:hypothetical protein [Campylobacterota bacterium]
SRTDVYGAINADDFHIHDLIDICDAVITINSGAGLIAALLGKPVFTLGDCWYTLPGIACDIKNEDEFFLKLNTFNPLEEKLLKFAYYLRFNFYSFGKHHTVIHTKANSKINATTKIDYTEVQTYKHGRIYFKDREYRVGFESILFKEYEADSFNEKKRSFLLTIVTSFLNNKKIQKFNKDPEAFFKDSKITIFRIIGKMLWK